MTLVDTQQLRLPNKASNNRPSTFFLILLYVAQITRTNPVAHYLQIRNPMILRICRSQARIQGDWEAVKVHSKPLRDPWCSTNRCWITWDQPKYVHQSLNTRDVVQRYEFRRQRSLKHSRPNSTRSPDLGSLYTLLLWMTFMSCFLSHLSSLMVTTSINLCSMFIRLS